MSPTDATYTPAAVARADLLVALCGRNALISLDRLIRAELTSLVSSSPVPVEALTADATWFPEVGDFMTPVRWVDAITDLNQAARDHGLNRKQRRQLRKGLFRGNTPRGVTRDLLFAGQREEGFADGLGQYPMRPEDAKVIWRYLVGKASAQEAEDAFLNSLRDPRWMMRWFADHHDDLNPVVAWIRQPSRDIVQRVRALATPVRMLRQIEAILGSGSRAGLLTSEGWKRAQDDFVLSVINTLLSRHQPDSEPPTEMALVDERCPGFSTGFRAFHSSLWNSVTDRPRTPKESDFADAVHAMYAPYVTIFRTDRYMAPHIRKHVGRHGTVIVGHLEDLPGQIARALNSGQEKGALLISSDCQPC